MISESSNSSESLREAVARRLREIDEGRVQMIPGEEVMERLRAVANGECRPSESNLGVDASKSRPMLSLFNSGVDLMFQNLRRRDPEADEATICRRMSRWLGNRTVQLTDDDVRKMGPVTLD